MLYSVMKSFISASREMVFISRDIIHIFACINVGVPMSVLWSIPCLVISHHVLEPMSRVKPSLQQSLLTDYGDLDFRETGTSR